MIDTHSSHLPKTGRVNQKLRTRRELLRGARELMQLGRSVTVAAAAKQVGISTATSYRYFSDPETLMVEAVAEMDLGSARDMVSELETSYQSLHDVGDRVVEAQRMMIKFVRDNENAYRLFLAKGHERIVSDIKREKGANMSSHRFTMIELALAPVRNGMSAQSLDDAVLAIASVCGPEPYFVLKDQRDLSNDEIDRLCERNLRSLVRTWIG